jgi:NitT/TauT family transport system substrate-binding protein
MTIRIMVSRHSAFYSPLICSIAGGFLEREGLAGSYAVLGAAERSHVLIREGRVDVMQSAVSSNWKALEQGESNLPVHFAQINQRDGFFLVGRDVGRDHDPQFDWSKLHGTELLADHGLQPLVMLRYAVHHNDASWANIQVRDAGTPEQMETAFRAGAGNYVHLQAPACQRLHDQGIGSIVTSVGAAMSPVAFSSLCCSREFLEGETFQPFLRAYSKAKAWVQTAPADEVAQKEASFFPETDLSSLSASVRRYQKLGCWLGELGIPRDLYEQALNVFEAAGEITRRHPYETVCGPEIE